MKQFLIGVGECVNTPQHFECVASAANCGEMYWLAMHGYVSASYTSDAADDADGGDCGWLHSSVKHKQKHQRHRTSGRCCTPIIETIIAEILGSKNYTYKN
ncbi:hypothetical protein, partial [Escherichia coli]|uniref:hypothetical protein n=1 Tax=Escherichia coli TaxID=562 RepID=UPI001BFEDAA3